LFYANEVDFYDKPLLYDPKVIFHLKGGNMKKCPFCKEEILEDAIRCKHCRMMLKMVAKKDGFESFWYCLMCVLSLGLWYGIRVMATIAIKKAINDLE